MSFFWKNDLLLLLEEDGRIPEEGEDTLCVLPEGNLLLDDLLILGEDHFPEEDDLHLLDEEDLHLPEEEKLLLLEEYVLFHSGSSSSSSR